MRKIEAKMLKAIHRGTDFKLDNTEVIHSGAEARVYLHGNLIAVIARTTVKVLDGGWESVTTKSRLNAILRGFTCGMGIYQKDWMWYLSGPEGDISWEGEHEMKNETTDWMFWQTVHAKA